MAKLRKRERVVIAIGVVTLTLLAVSKPISGTLDTYSKSAGQLLQAQDRLLTAQLYRAEVEMDRRGGEAIVSKIGAREPQFSLYTFVTRSVSAAKLQDRHQLVTASAAGSRFERVQLTLTGVSMKELVNLLHKIYSSDNLIVLQKLDHLRATRDGKGLEFSATFTAPKR